MQINLAMSWRIISLLALLLALFLGLGYAVWHHSTSTGADSSETKERSLSLRDCGEIDTDDKKNLRVQCYWLKTERDGQFELPIAVISRQSSDTALLHIAGGPGDGDQTSAENIQEWLNWYQKSSLSADLVLYSPRGTPGASGSFVCEAYEAFSWQILTQNLTHEAELRAGQAIVSDCLEEFAQSLASVPGVSSESPLASFGTTQQADDARRILQELGYQHWHLWGVSYGTRVAMVAANQVKIAGDTRLNSLVLDSPYPPGKGSLADWPGLLENAFQLHEKKRSGFRQQWQGLVKRLQHLDQPLIFNLDNWHYNLDPCPYKISPCIQHEKQIPFLLNADRLLSVAYYVLYDESLLESFYIGLQTLGEALEVKSSVANNFELELVLESFLASAFAPSFSPWVFFATECADNGVAKKTEIEQASTEYPVWQKQLKAEYQYDVCRDKRFFSGQPALAATQQLPNIPVLIFVGEYDPVTPVSWAKRLAADNSQTRLIIANGVGHSVLFSDYCEANVLGLWFKNPLAPLCIQEGT